MSKKSLLLFFASMISFQAQCGLKELVSYVSAQTDVPEWVISKVCTHESQSFYKNQRQPWPWTTNESGRGRWFSSMDAAVAYAEKQIKSGTKNIDVGICQMNWRYHGHKFDSVEDMFNPVRNMLEAAKFIKTFKKDSNSWVDAIGKYHSPGNEERAAAYIQKVLAKS
ncbi:hypothetical protein [Vibrio fluvialis]|uniref:hypothetical protein n=1 Tax=Vibrio fluvialis TaxID=676 RepID=UPI00192B5691|nr:hypothetical protein [Vibrio fluvialis]MBL4262829.1 hypothetical protein [Vibrio fluvialis]